MLARVVISRGLASRASLIVIRRQFASLTTKHQPLPLHTSSLLLNSSIPSHFLQPRFYSTTQNPENKKDENTTENSEQKTEEPTKEETQKQQEEDANKEKKEEDIIEPEWKTTSARARPSFQKKQAGPQEVKVSKELAGLYWLLGLAGAAICIYKGVELFQTMSKENSAVPDLVFRKALEQLMKTIMSNQQAIEKQAKGPCVPDEQMVQRQMFDGGKITTVTFPLLQPVGNFAKLGTVYMDLEREGDYFHLRHAYIDFVWGKSYDLVEAGLVKPEEYTFFLFDQEFSAMEYMKLMQQEAEEYARQQHEQLKQQQQQQQRRCTSSLHLIDDLRY